MPRNLGYDRVERVGDLMHRAIARLLSHEFKDPRIGLTTVAAVEVSQDLSHAKVFVTVLEENKVQVTISLLNKATGFFRNSLASMKALRVIPKIRFYYDESVAQGAKMEALIAASCVN